MNPVVSICCQTYNHKNYIRKAIESFLMQKTNFPIEILLRDDASTDGTTEIVKEYSKKYPDIINPLIYTENQWQKGVSPLFDNVKRARGKYIALCEGDDYWTDPLKLQKQVDFLENNPDYGLVYTKCNRSDTLKSIGRDLKRNEIFYKNLIPTLTCVFNKDIASDYLNSNIGETINWKMGDYPLWLWFYVNSKIGFIDEVTALYRVLPESVSHNKDGNKRVMFNISSYEIAKYFGKTYLSDNEYNKLLNYRLFLLVLSCLKHKSYHLQDIILKIRELDNKAWYNKMILFLLSIKEKI